MALDFFRIDKGLDINGNVVILEGSGAAGGTTDTDAAAVGSIYTDTATGNLYLKDTAGAGTDKWELQASKSYVDAVASGLDIKASVRLATAAALPAYTAAGSGVGKTLTANAVGALTVDGVPTALNNRVLVKDEGASHADHGIYTVSTLGVTAVAEITDVTTVADVGGNLGGTYFTLNSPSAPYYVWYNTGASIDPAPGGTGIQVNITANDSANTVASLTQAAVDGDAAFVATVLTNVVTVTNAVVGVATDATAGTSGFTANVTTQGVTGVAFVLTRATDADQDAEVTAGLFVLVAEGTANADSGWVLTTNDPITVDTTALAFSQFSSASLAAELGYIRAFIGKGASGNEMPNYSSNNFVTDSTSLEDAIGALDAELGPNVTNGTYILAASKINANIQALDTALGLISTKTTASAVTTITTLDTVALADANYVKWAVVAINASSSTNRYAAEIDALNDGATVVDYNKFGVVKIGSNITGLSFTVDVSGADMRLRVASTTSVNVIARRITAL